MQLDPTVADAVGGSATKYLLGWGYCPVLQPKLGGKGPTVKMNPMQRPIEKKATAVLVEVAGPKGEGLLRMDTIHALTYVVDPKLVDLGSLTMDVKGPFKEARWKLEGVSDEDSIAIQYAGAHRIEAFKSVHKPTLDAIQAAEKKLAKKEIVGVRQELNKLREALNEKATWLIAFYDCEFCFIGSDSNLFKD